MLVHKYVILSIAKDLLAVKEFCVRLHFCNPRICKAIPSHRTTTTLVLGYIFVIRKRVIEYVYSCVVLSLFAGYIFVTRNVVE